MKKLFFLAVSSIVVVACNNSQSQPAEDTQKTDSLENIISQQQDELDELMTSFTDINDGFARIAEAEGRIKTLSTSDGEKPELARNIQENMDYIAEVMKDNKERINQLQSKLDASGIKSGKLQDQLNKLQEQYEEKVKEIEELQKKLAERDIHIKNLTDTVAALVNENKEVKYDREVKEMVIEMQDEQINTAYYVYGTKKELKEHKILDGSEVMKGDFDKAYFTTIDIRNFDTLPLNSKSVELLTSHPAGSYTMTKDAKGLCTLKITDSKKFWSISKYLVVKVK